MQKSHNVVLNMNTRQVRLNLFGLDLDKIYDEITPLYCGIEIVTMNEKNKHSDKLSEKNEQIIKRIKPKDKKFFLKCIGIRFSEWGLRLFRNGCINAICFPDEETYEKDMKILFDVLKDIGYDLHVISQKDILKKNSPIITTPNENRIKIYL